MQTNHPNPLQQLFEKTTQKNLEAAVVVKAIMELLVRRGIHMSKSQIRALERDVRAGNGEKLVINLTKKQEALLDGAALNLASIDQDMLNQLLDDTLKQHEPQMPAQIDEVAKSISKVLTKDIKKRIATELKAREQQQVAFERRLNSRWKRALDLLHTLVFVATEAGENASAQMGTRQGHLMPVLFRLHARACQVAQEIVALLRGGFADGAHARWRTLHELAVTAFFNSQHGESTAERYVLHERIETYKAAEQYQKYCQRLGYAPLSKREFAANEKRKDQLIKRFGKPFGTDYGWAADVLNNPRPTFRDIEERVQLDHLRPFYKLACNNVHAGAKGIFERLGLFDHEELLLAGPSSIGLADPGHSTAISLTQITTCLLVVQPSLDNFVTIEVLNWLQDDAGEQFLKASGSRN